MKLLFILLLISLSMGISCTLLCTENQQKDLKPLLTNITTPRCSASPLSTLLQKYYTGHPYKNVNIHKDLSILDPYSLILGIGNADKYTPEANSIGKGHFGKVFKAKHQDSNITYALKVIDSSTSNILREIKILQDLKDAPNFLPIKEILIDHQKFGQPFTLVFDYFASRSIKEMMKTVTKTSMKKFMYETFKTLDYIHSRGIIHRDMKFWNVLMNPDTQEVRLIDFGIADYYLPSRGLSCIGGTLNYKAPETFLFYYEYDYSVDVWAAGVMLGEMMFRNYHLFATKRPENLEGKTDNQKRSIRYRNQLDAITSVLGTVDLLQYANKFQNKMNLKYLVSVDDHKKMPWKDLVNQNNQDLVDASGLDLISKLLVFDHTKRLTAKEAMSHSFFDEVRDSSNN